MKTERTIALSFRLNLVTMVTRSTYHIFDSLVDFVINQLIWVIYHRVVLLVFEYACEALVYRQNCRSLLRIKMVEVTVSSKIQNA